MKPKERKTDYQAARDARAEEIIFNNKLSGALNPKAFVDKEKDPEYVDLNYAYRICAMENIFYGMPLLVKHLDEIKHLVEEMNERHHRLRNAVHESREGAKEDARRHVGKKL